MSAEPLSFLLVVSMLRSLSTPEAWEEALANITLPRSGAFLQSKEWGAFQTAAGRVVKRYAFEDGPRLALAQGLEFPMPFGMTYLSFPRGPVGDSSAAVELIAAAGKETGACFVRFEPVSSGAPAGARKTVDLQPADTLIMDLRQPADIRLAAMHHKTRYNLRLAERKGVEIAMAGSLDDVWFLFEQTAKRGGFALHAKSYYAAMLETLSEGPCRAFLAIALHEGKPVAANIMIDHQGTRTYLHGASGDTSRELMAPYLLHWRLIEDASARGMSSYDWWGVSPDGASETHPWAGVTRFKLGFGGERVSYPGTFDAVLNVGTYAAYAALRHLRRMI